MYTKRIQITNYGPIDHLDITLPFHDDTPKPVVLVGENGSGKSILLSHIVNGLIEAKGIAYPHTPEVESGKVYKLRSSLYIQPGAEYYFCRVDLDNSLFVGELRLRYNKQDYSDMPVGISGTSAEAMWDKLNPKDNDYYDSILDSSSRTENDIRTAFERNCVLYFPFNRSEEPAWLNEDNLKAQARYTDLKHLKGYTNRQVIASSPLNDNQNWLFEVIYDRAVFEIQTQKFTIPNDTESGRIEIPLPIFAGYAGNATNVYEAALQMARVVMRRGDVRFGIGSRSNRIVSIESPTGSLVPNIFQLSSGETSLLNLFLSILRDFDWCGVSFSSTADIRGVVVVDEIDLHLHAIHQYEVLPKLIKAFPKVQFIVTSHSPLFVLGMSKVFGEDGFSLYKMPQGQELDSEGFSEFHSAYRSFVATQKFNDDITTAIEKSKKPIVFLEGVTDLKYFQKAVELLGQEVTLGKIEIQDGGGKGNMVNIWKGFRQPLTNIIPQKVLLLFDCDANKPDQNRGNLFQRTIPFQADNPIEKGIENLFGQSILDRAQRYNPTFIDITGGHTRLERGEEKEIPERWIVNESEKINLCDWICKNGTREDFEHFCIMFAILEEVLGPDC